MDKPEDHIALNLDQARGIYQMFAAVLRSIVLEEPLEEVEVLGIAVIATWLDEEIAKAEGGGADPRMN